jgi:hypothetical protein
MKYLKSIFEFLLESKEPTKFWEKDKLKREIVNFENKLKEKKFLNDNNFDDVIKILERDCSTFLREIKKSKSVVFRGFKKIGSPHTEDEESIPGLYKKERRRGRNTLDLRRDLSDDLDDIFIKMFNFNLRSDGIFTTKSPSTAAGYSDNQTDFRYKRSYIFFPIGDYDYYWNPDIDDLFSHVEDEDWYRYYDEDDDSYEWEYYDIYGDPRDYPYSSWNGYFELNGVEIRSRFHPRTALTEYIFNNYNQFGLEAPKDNRIKIGDDIVNINTDIRHIGALKWIPSMTLEEFIESLKFDKEDKLHEITNGYKSGDIENASIQEITFDCDHYYLIEEDYYFKLIEYLENN